MQKESVHFPIKITQQVDIRLFIVIFIFVVLLWNIVPSILPNLPNFLLNIILIGISVVIIVLAYSYKWQRQLILANSAILYKEPFNDFMFSYADIIKVGYHADFYYTRGGIACRGVVRVYTKNSKSSQEIEVSAFSDEDALRFLNILKHYASHALFGEKIIEIIHHKKFPWKDPSAFSLLGEPIDDIKFVKVGNK